MALHAPICTLPPVAAEGARLAKSSITESWSREACVLSMQCMPVFDPALMATPAKITVPAPIVTSAAICAEGCTAVQKSKPGIIKAIFCATVLRVWLSPMAIMHPCMLCFSASEGMSAIRPSTVQESRDVPSGIASSARPAMRYFPSFPTQSMITFACPEAPMMSIFSNTGYFADPIYVQQKVAPQYVNFTRDRLPDLYLCFLFFNFIGDSVHDT